ncbi:MAG: class I SAM-dependent methyltransferase [Gammaproteobacteria bacterium]|nr:MAG: hypothetical protein CBD85_003090 [Gammaproteobacteria bacterium TMED225]|tara:strand:+ start:117 stop:848 length:732 start_codon:yes stop_codon:yes gene_type:complete
MKIHISNKDFIKNVEDVSIFLKAEITFDIPKNKSYLFYDKDGLSYIKDASFPRERLHVDFLKGKLAWRIKRSQHEGNLKKALGKPKRTLSIFDATAGLLSDSMIFLSLGHKVVALEQSKIIYSLVNDALDRAGNKISYLKNLTFINEDSIAFYKKNYENFDVIYLDPMYPIIKKNTKKTGNIEHIKKILEYEELKKEDSEIIEEFLKCKFKKIILKRPLKSKKTYSNINYQVKGKTTKFDIYL